MTMADTVAVMCGGVIEQMGRPEDLYEHPRTTFVANFLGQSNLIRGTVQGRLHADVEVEVQGHRVLVPQGRSVPGAVDVWVGVRPEKVGLAAVGAEPVGGANVLSSGVVTDVSFTGMSTQYLVRMPWGQELTVFEQNSGVHKVRSSGEAVDLHWVPDHTFLLDAQQDAEAGVTHEDDQ